MINVKLYVEEFLHIHCIECGTHYTSKTIKNCAFRCKSTLTFYYDSQVRIIRLYINEFTFHTILKSKCTVISIHVFWHVDSTSSVFVFTFENRSL